MKKIFYLASIAALALSSCTKDQTTEAQIESVKGGSKIVAAVEAGGTRTHLETTNDVDFEYRWSEGDQIAIYGYGEGTLSNAAFVLDKNSYNQPTGVFTSQHELNPAKPYMAVYPRFAEPLFDVAADKYVEDIKATYPNDESYGPMVTDGRSVEMRILPVQKYQDKTFYTTTAPSISGSFEVNAEGESIIGMQPVVDYLMVNLTSTEEIKSLTLALLDRKAGNKWLAISGNSNLASYWFNGENGWEYRYFIPEGNATAVAHATMPVDDAQAQYEATRLNKYTITIKTDEAYKTIACHEPNTFVFTIPAGILGMNGNVDAYVWVNEVPDITSATDTNLSANIKSSHFWSSADLKVTDSNKANYEVLGTDTNAQMNYALAANGVTKISRMDANKSNENMVVRQLENTVFWMNSISVDTNGDGKNDARGSFMYNPNEDVIIHDQVQLLEYFTNYNVKGTDQYHKDAFLCSGATFDFSEAKMLELAAEKDSKKYDDYVANYLANGFPCISEYTNNFVGNGATIQNVKLQSLAGLFGGDADAVSNGKHHKVDLSVTRAGSENVSPTDRPTISNVTFANITAKIDEGKKQYDKNDKPYRMDTYGYILATAFDGDIKDVTVTGSFGEAVMLEATAIQLAGMTIKNSANLCNVFERLMLNDHINMTNYADLATVSDAIFENIVPAAYDGAAFSYTDTEESDLNVITIAEGDGKTYAKLTDKVVYDPQTVDHVAAVVIKGVSYWTGGKWNVKDYAYNANQVKVGTTPVGRKIQYAEELAYGYTETGMKAVLARDIDLNWANLQWKDGSYTPWTMQEFNELDGDGKSVSNATMVVYDWTLETPEEGVAPFDAPTIKNLKMNNVTIYIKTPAEDTSVIVPEFIGGVVLDANSITNVTLNNLVINAYRSDDSANEEANYGVGRNSKIGWVAAKANGTVKMNTIAVNGVTSNVKGISGVVGQVTMSATTDSAQFVSVNATNVNDSVNAAMTGFASYNVSKIYKAEGTAVGYVINEKGANIDANVEFKQSGKPVFLFTTPYAVDRDGKVTNDAEIVVNYDQSQKVVLPKDIL